MSQTTNMADAMVTVSNNAAHTTDNLVNLVGSGGSRVYTDATNAIAATANAGGDVAVKAADLVGKGAQGVYEAFVNTVLPAVGQGLVVTKDYFFDLFGRQVTYLAITDGLSALFCAAAFGYCVYALVKAKNVFTSDNHVTEGVVIFHVLSTVAALCASVPALMGTYSNGIHFVQDITVPEIRIAVQVMEFKKSLEENK